MSKYETLDGMVLRKISAAQFGISFNQLLSGQIATESGRIATEDRKDTFRVLDARLQALRKKGLIAFSKKSGWLAVSATGSAE